MPEKSSLSAKVVFLDKSGIMHRLIEAVKRLRADSNVNDVKLFGSLSKGNFVPGSDADVLIVLKNDSRRMIDRIPEYLDFFMRVPFPVEVFPYTEEEISRMSADGNRFILNAVENGLDLTAGPEP
jgi:uncharacterized protein